MMHYLDSLLARATGAPETGRLVMPRPVSLFEPVSGAAWEPPVAGDAGAASAGAYDQPDANVPGPPMTRSAPVRGVYAYNPPERLSPGVQPHPSTDDTSSSVLSGRPVQDASAGENSLPVLSRTPAQDAPKGESSSPDASRAAASSVQGAPTTRSTPGWLAPELQPHPSTGSGALPTLRPTPGQDAATGDVPSPVSSHALAQDAPKGERSSPDGRRAAASNLQGTPITRKAPVRGADAHMQSGRLIAELQPHPSTGGRALPTLRPAPAQDASTGDITSPMRSETPVQDAAVGGSPPRVGGRTGRDSGSDMTPHPPATSVAAGQRTAPTGAASAPAAPPEAPPVVRVTIGRVDVRAVLPPPVEPPRSPSAPGPLLSLDDYLKRGRGGA